MVLHKVIWAGTLEGFHTEKFIETKILTRYSLLSFGVLLSRATVGTFWASLTGYFSFIRFSAPPPYLLVSTGIICISVHRCSLDWQLQLQCLKLFLLYVFKRQGGWSTSCLTWVP